jgi:hypothetical protein
VLLRGPRSFLSARGLVLGQFLVGAEPPREWGPGLGWRSHREATPIRRPRRGARERDNESADTFAQLTVPSAATLLAGRRSELATGCLPRQADPTLT